MLQNFFWNCRCFSRIYISLTAIESLFYHAAVCNLCLSRFHSTSLVINFAFFYIRLHLLFSRVISMNDIRRWLQFFFCRTRCHHIIYIDEVLASIASLAAGIYYLQIAEILAIISRTRVYISGYILTGRKPIRSISVTSALHK